MTIVQADVVIKVVIAAFVAGVAWVGPRHPNLAGFLLVAILIKAFCMQRALRCPTCRMSAHAAAGTAHLPPVLRLRLPFPRRVCSGCGGGFETVHVSWSELLLCGRRARRH